MISITFERKVLELGSYSLQNSDGESLTFLSRLPGSGPHQGVEGDAADGDSSISSNSVFSSLCSCGVQVAGCLPFGRYRMMMKMENTSANCGLCRMPPISSSSGHVMALLQDWSTSGAAHGREKMSGRNLDSSLAAEGLDDLFQDNPGFWRSSSLCCVRHLGCSNPASMI